MRVVPPAVMFSCECESNHNTIHTSHSNILPPPPPLSPIPAPIFPNHQHTKVKMSLQILTADLKNRVCVDFFLSNQ